MMARADDAGSRVRQVSTSDAPFFSSSSSQSQPDGSGTGTAHCALCEFMLLGAELPRGFVLQLWQGESHLVPVDDRMFLCVVAAISFSWKIRGPPAP
jgi:hypothetical protein